MVTIVPPFKPSTQLQGVTDLTLLAPIKPGLIEGIFDSKSYVWRLERVLQLLDAARRGSREAELEPNPFADPVGRLRDVHFFRFAIDPRARQLVLNVTFDGGWEPYMRLIWGPLGTMLDLIFCHCVDYPLAATSDYSDYIAWVREREVPSQFFYADSPGSVADRSYLEQVERAQRVSGDQPQADLRSVKTALTALDALPRAPATPKSVASAIRSLKGLYGLAPYFGTVKPTEFTAATWGTPAPASGHVLLRFAQDYLPDLRAWVSEGLFDPGQRYDTLRASFDTERRWLMVPRWARPERQDPPALIASDVQAGVLSPWQVAPQQAVRGALVLVRIRPGALAATAARTWLAKAAASGLIADETRNAITGAQVSCTLALTFPGLKAVQLSQTLLSELPLEFQQGMEARAGILGDLRSNHPRYWQRPRPWLQTAGAPELPLELSLVHLVLQLRCLEQPSDTPRTLLSTPLSGWIARHLQPQPFLEVLAVEPCWSEPPRAGDPATRNLFGYVDGLSQPVPGGPATGTGLWDDAVKRGEALLGWVNDRGDGPRRPPADGEPAAAPSVRRPGAWADNGTFLVVRKIRMHVERFEAVVAEGAAVVRAAGLGLPAGAAERLVRAKLMGREDSGMPTVQPRGPGLNDFNYRLDPDGAQCPFASHVRRANPRAALPNERVPRLIRRGMSYGAPVGPGAGPDPQPRGLLFMAYNASIAEQFEVIQRWIAGGNSSGVASTNADPFLGVPRPGEPRVFRCEERGQVLRFSLGDQPLCSLAWGLYAFVPSLTLLRTLEAHVSAERAPTSPAPPIPPGTAKEIFEDEWRRPSAWQRVREGPMQAQASAGQAAPGALRIDQTVLVGSDPLLREVLYDGGDTYSAAGYGARMAATLGPSPFGQDHSDAVHGHGRPIVAEVKRAIHQAVREDEAYVTAFEWVRQDLVRRLTDAQAAGVPAVPVDLVAFGADLVTELCRQWFGVPDGVEVEAGRVAVDPQPPRCPAHLLSTARSVFSAQPNQVVIAAAAQQGPALRDALPAAFCAARSSMAKVPVLRALDQTIRRPTSGHGLTPDEVDGTYANALLGLPATFLGTWCKVLIGWANSPDRVLWQLQHALVARETASTTYGAAVVILRDVVVETMALDPVADGIWRTAAKALPANSHLGIQVQKDDQVWLGLGSALLDLKARLAPQVPGDPVQARQRFLAQAESILFGGTAAKAGDPEAPHACPGRPMAMGALLGGIAALLSAGVWSATASPTTLTLQPMLMPTPPQ